MLLSPGLTDISFAVELPAFALKGWLPPLFLFVKEVWVNGLGLASRCAACLGGSAMQACGQISSRLQGCFAA